MGKLPILTFEPLLKETVWGGRLLESRLKKELPGDGPFGETWEVVDLPSNQSVVLDGVLSGKILETLCVEDSEDLLGGASLLDGRFPLLFKFIDAQKTLSVQVHPDEAACARLGAGARPKTEAWYVIDCEPDAVLYVGLQPGVERQEFAESVKVGAVEQLLHCLPVEPGDFVFLPSGTIHAIGAGILLAEVQQSSNTTYRVFDWNRVGLDGRPRQLHVDEALESIAFGTSGLQFSDAPSSGRPGIACDYFVMESVLLKDGEQAQLRGEGLLVLMGTAGDGEVAVYAGDDSSRMGCGQTRLVPAGRAQEVRLEGSGQTTLLAVRIPSL